MYNLSVLALPIFVAGILKYGERTWVLWSASCEKFSNTVDMSHSNGGPDNNLHFDSVDPQAKFLLVGHELFKNIVRHLYLNLSIDRQDVKLFYDVLCGYSSNDSEDVFKLMEGVPKHVGIERLIGICEKSEKYWFMTFEDVSKEMKLYILTQLQDARALIRDGRNVKEVLNRRGSQALEDRNCLEQLSWTVTGPRLPFHKSILYWHIATDVCYYHDVDTQGISPTSKLSKLLSDYMAYILVMRPFMLPKGIGQISVRDTCSHAIAFCKERRRLITNRNDARRVLLQEESIVAPSGLGK
ncbi:hypothetical protein ACLB2K_007322 [Fragaria x ananassa]